MIALEYQILLAVCLDLALGDPRWALHPVRLMGRFAQSLEEPLRKLLRIPRLAGCAAALSVISVAVLVTYALVWAARTIHPIAGDVVSVLLIYTGIAAGDLIKHSRDVVHALQSDDLDEARRRVGMICGRDTDALDESGVARATVESVAENLVDGVTAPIFYAAIGGPVGLMAYKAVSTLDSMFGYKNELYREFGWAAARLDDVAAFIPSRLSAILVPLAALVLKMRAADSLKVFFRDRNKHPSPNAGQCEASFAGALGVRLGGPSYYGGRPSLKPEIGDSSEVLRPMDIQRANSLMLITSFVALLLFLGLRLAIVALWRQYC